MRHRSAGVSTPGCWGSGRGTGPGDPATEPEAAKHAEALLADLELAYGPVRLAAAVHAQTGKVVFSREGSASGLCLPLGRRALADAAAADRAVEKAVAAAASVALGVECVPVSVATPAAEHASRTGSLSQTSWRALSPEGSKAVAAALALWRAAEASQRAAKAVPSALEEEVARGAGVPIGVGAPESPTGSETGKRGGSFRDAWAGSNAVASIEVIDESESDLADHADETGGSKGAGEDRAGFGPDGASVSNSVDYPDSVQSSAAAGGGAAAGAPHRTASGRDASGGAGSADKVPVRVSPLHQTPAGPTVAASSLRAALRPVSTAAARAAQRMLRPGCDLAPSPGSTNSSGSAGRRAGASASASSSPGVGVGGEAGAGAAASPHRLGGAGHHRTSSGSGEAADDPEGAVVVRSVGCDVSVLCLPLPAPADKVVLFLVVSRGPRGQWGGAGLHELLSECDAGGSVLGDAQWQRARAQGAMLALGVGSFRLAVKVRAENTQMVVPLQRGKEGLEASLPLPLTPADRAVAAAVFNAADAATAVVRAWLAVAVAGLTMVPRTTTEPPGPGGCGDCCTVS